MLWKRTTSQGGFWGLLVGMASSIGMWIWVRLDPAALSIIAGSTDAKAMAEDMYRALWSWLICVAVTVVVSYMTKPKPEAELTGLVRGCTELPSEGHLKLTKRPIFWAGVVSVVFVILQIIFW
jgi:SSS family solute:Na+ symporter